MDTMYNHGMKAGNMGMTLGSKMGLHAKQSLYEPTTGGTTITMYTNDIRTKTHNNQNKKDVLNIEAVVSDTIKEGISTMSNLGSNLWKSGMAQVMKVSGNDSGGRSINHVSNTIGVGFPSGHNSRTKRYGGKHYHNKNYLEHGSPQSSDIYLQSANLQEIGHGRTQLSKSPNAAHYPMSSLQGIQSKGIENYDRPRHSELKSNINTISGQHSLQDSFYRPHSLEEENCMTSGASNPLGREEIAIANSNAHDETHNILADRLGSCIDKLTDYFGNELQARANGNGNIPEFVWETILELKGVQNELMSGPRLNTPIGAELNN
eukprot:CAMPEP_0184860308 /NCGR_PEP_ID=MMETSP0580-20130426/5221_1 /TAXON_ID=1118495 /ORGANISM="Dactyliosolen fragilissimus" /LENGTH=319 /DNA_ID=CAMNT_0027357365 /DNA_START=102 /DNA_END=1059 /DNA_ORIENTATION=+